MKRTALSLFTSGGLGDLAVRQAGFDILVSNEKLADRHALFAFNFPATSALTGDIWEHSDRIESETRRRLGGRDLQLLYATPPCQGMSKNGRGKLLSAVRAGRKPPMDERNRLIVPTMQLARRLRPETVLLENVPEMADTMILDERGSPTPILEYVERTLGPSTLAGTGGGVRGLRRTPVPPAPHHRLLAQPAHRRLASELWHLDADGNAHRQRLRRQSAVANGARRHRGAAAARCGLA